VDERGIKEQQVVTKRSDGKSFSPFSSPSNFEFTTLLDDENENLESVEINCARENWREGRGE
jgi:hypothetical protein